MYRRDRITSHHLTSCLNLFLSIVLLKDECATIFALSEEGAEIFIETIDRVRLSRRHLSNYLISEREGIPRSAAAH